MVDWHKMFTGKPDPNYTERNLYDEVGRAIGVPILAIFFIPFCIWVFISHNRERLGSIFLGVVAFLALILVLMNLRKIIDSIRLSQAIREAPSYGPWDVDMRQTKIRGRPYHYVFFRLRPSKEDWATIVEMDLQDVVVTEVPPLNERDREGNRERYGQDTRPIPLSRLIAPKKGPLPFADALDALAAKEELVENLNRLKLQVEAYREAKDAGAHDTRIEI